jgi:streptogramin lyase
MRCVGRAAVTRNAVGMAIAVVVLLCGGAVPGAAMAAPTITEYTAGNPLYAQPLGILDAPTEAKPGGALWFTVNESLSPGFGIMSTSGQFEKFDEEEPLLLGSTNPRELALGPGGDLWVTEDGTDPVIRWGDPSKSPYSLPNKLALPTGSDPIGVAKGPGGEMWFTEGDGTGKIVKVNPTTGKITGEYSAGLLSGGEPAQIVAGSDGNMWFAERGGAGAIGRITPAGEITLFQKSLTADSAPWGVALGAEGDIWFTELSLNGKIGRVTPSGEITEYEGSDKGEPGEIVAADNGDLYFSERGGEKKAGHEGALAQITPAGVITQFTAGLTEANTPWAIAVGPDGDIWFTELGEAKIGRLTIPPGIAVTSAGTPGETEATLEADVLPNAQSSTLAFEYGPTGIYGATSSPVGVGAGTTASAGSAQLSGLEPGTTYHYRALATNASGTTYGPDTTFTTAAAPPAEPPSEEAPPSEEPSHGEEPPPGEAPPPGEEAPSKETPAGPSPSEDPPGKTPEETKPPTEAGSTSTAPVAAPTPLSTDLSIEPLTPVDPATTPPVLGRSGAVSVSSGIVLVRDPRTGRFVPVSGVQDVPVGATLDTTNGVLSLTTALPGDREQTATIWGGRFEFRQSRYGRIQLYLRGEIGPCRVRGHAAVGLGAPLASAAKHDAKRELWSKDSHGRYTTHGANSAATVLGTEWLTVDSCSGTLTRVRRGHVKVSDLREHRNVVLGPGQSYLARG